LREDDKELRERWDRDAPKCWQIMPFYRPKDEIEWWVMEKSEETKYKTVTGKFYDTREEAFRIAYEHNSKTYGIYAVFVRGACGKNGGWKQT
jgi:hypothetical protein